MSSTTPVPVSSAPPPVETKVKAGSFASLLITAAAFALHFAWPGFGNLPAYGQTLIAAAVAAGATFAAGYAARHTPRSVEFGGIEVDLADAAEAIEERLPDYRDWLKVDLYDEAAARGIPGRSSMTKAELARKLRADDKSRRLDTPEVPGPRRAG